MSGDKEDLGWHLDRRVQISHIIATATAVLSCLYYVSRLEQRIALVEQVSIEQRARMDRQWSEQRARDERQDAATTKTSDAMQAHLTRIEDKLDRVIERQKVVQR